MSSNTRVHVAFQTKRIQYLGSPADQRAPNMCPHDNHKGLQTSPRNIKKEKKISPSLAESKPPKPKGSSSPPIPVPVHVHVPLLAEKQPLLTALQTLQTACSSLLIWPGGILAILLQFASPGIAKGSCAHSRFTTHPVSRFRRTAIYIYAVTHGTPLEKKLITTAIKKQHSFISGPTYSASDPDLQKWTAATLFVGAVTTLDTFSSPWKSPWRRVMNNKPALSRAEREELCMAFSEFATALDMPADMWPGTLDEFDEYYETTLKEYEQNLGKESKSLAGVLLNGEMDLPWVVKVPLVHVMRVLMAFWLPPGLRVAFGLPDPDDGWAVWLAYVVLVWIVWAVDWIVPEMAKDLVRNWMKRDMQRAADDIRVHGRWMV
ncbi:hypothetical protein QBC44DRAFT_348809 [Cladorrhinum sp. PSN332]|nr:hypothetical protein QBC44DRAFT_348809 [Cladorrhinum sp. PSN332]